MQLRTLLLMVNMTTIVAAIVILREYPQYVGTANYLLLGWLVGSLVLLYGPWGSRPIGSGRSGAGSSAPTAATPLPSASPPSDIPFCIYCAAPLTIHAPVCPACGHRTPYL